MKNHSKTENVFRNAAIGIIDNVAVLALHLLSRKLFLQYLGIEYLSVEQVVSSILTILSFSEMGIGNAVLYMLYQPVAQGDHRKITQIVNAFRRLNTMIGCVIIGLGLCCMPFLHLFITTSLPMRQVYGIFLLRLAYSASSYFCAHRRMLINADQKNRIVSIVGLAVNLLGVTGQCAALVLTHSYTVFIVVLIATLVAQNLILHVIGGKLYPYLKEDRHSRLDKESVRNLYTYVKSLLSVKIGGIVINNTDNILVSIINTLMVGYMANYTTVTVRLKQLLAIFHNAIVYSLGIASVEKDAAEKYRLFRKVVLIDQFVVGIVSVCTGVLWHDFITLWLGTDFLINDLVMYSVLLNFMWVAMSAPLWMFRDTNGMFVHIRWMILLNAAANLLLSIWMGKLIGVAGVYLATVLADILTDFWFDAKILYNCLFERKDFWKYNLLTLAANGLNLVLVYAIRRLLAPIHLSLAAWVFKGAAAAAIYCAVYLLLYGRSQVFRDVLNQILLPRLPWRKKKV